MSEECFTLGEAPLRRSLAHPGVAHWYFLTTSTLPATGGEVWDCCMVAGLKALTAVIPASTSYHIHGNSLSSPFPQMQSLAAPFHVN